MIVTGFDSGNRQHWWLGAAASWCRLVDRHDPIDPPGRPAHGRPQYARVRQAGKRRRCGKEVRARRCEGAVTTDREFVVASPPARRLRRPGLDMETMVARVISRGGPGCTGSRRPQCVHAADAFRADRSGAWCRRPLRVNAGPVASSSNGYHCSAGQGVPAREPVSGFAAVALGT